MTQTQSIETLAAEFARLDAEAASGYVAHDGDEQDWPTVGFACGGGTGHAVISVHPNDIAKAVEVLRQYDDGEANVTGPESLLYRPQESMAAAGIRCKWHV